MIRIGVIAFGVVRALFLRAGRAMQCGLGGEGGLTSKEVERTRGDEQVVISSHNLAACANDSPAASH